MEIQKYTSVCLIMLMNKRNLYKMEQFIVMIKIHALRVISTYFGEALKKPGINQGKVLVAMEHIQLDLLL